MPRPTDVVIDANTALGFRVVVVRSSWDAIIELKHPEMRGRDAEVRQTLSDPDEIRYSVSRRHTLLFYRATARGNWVVAVTRRQGNYGYLVTVYESTNIKSGELAWQK